MRTSNTSRSPVPVFWFYDEEDDTMQELGEEFGEDLANTQFHLEKMAE